MGPDHNLYAFSFENSANIKHMSLKHYSHRLNLIIQWNFSSNSNSRQYLTGSQKSVNAKTMSAQIGNLWVLFLSWWNCF